MVKFSVIILINNSEKFIRECLDSVINQTLTDIEIIGIDLNSQDKSLNILKEYADNDNRIKIIDDIEDWGAAKNKAIELAQGGFITFVEANDKLTVNALDSVYGYFKKNDDITEVSPVPQCHGAGQIPIRDCPTNYDDCHPIRNNRGCRHRGEQPKGRNYGYSSQIPEGNQQNE